MAEPLKKAPAGSQADQPRPVRGRSERDLGDRTKRPPRGERAASGKQPKSSGGAKRSGGNGGSSRSGQSPRVHTAGGSPRRPRGTKAGTGARIMAPLALAVCVLACFMVLSSQGSDGSVNSSSNGDSSSASSSSGSKQSGTAAEPTRSVYVVKAGDSFSAIAVKFGVDVDTLQELNPEIDPRALQPGQKLKLKE